MAYTPEYYNQLQQYYAGYLPGQTLNAGGLQNWYADTSGLPFGGSSVVNTLPSSTGGLLSSLLSDGGADSASPTGPATDDAGLAAYSNISPAMVTTAATIAGILGVPFTSVISMNSKSIANNLSNMAYNAAVAQNIANIAAQLGLDPNNPANAAAISAAIDSASSFAPGTAAATTGPTGTGGAAAAAAAAAASAAAAAGFSAAAQGAAAQAAADAVVGGQSPADAAAAAAAAADASAADTGSSAGDASTGPD